MAADKAAAERKAAEKKHLLVSARFDGGEKEKFARDIYKELRASGVNAFMVEEGAGGNFATQTIRGLDQMYAMLAVCYDTYGAKTASVYSTYYELTYANENRSPIIPLKLYPDEWPPAPQDSDGGWAGRAQNKFVFKQGLVYLDGVGKSAAVCAHEVKVALADLEARGRIPFGASAQVSAEQADDAAQSAHGGGSSAMAAAGSAAHAVGASQGAAVAEQGAQQAAGRAERSAQGAAGSSAMVAAGSAAFAVGAASAGESAVQPVRQAMLNETEFEAHQLRQQRDLRAGSLQRVADHFNQTGYSLSIREQQDWPWISNGPQVQQTPMLRSPSTSRESSPGRCSADFGLVIDGDYPSFDEGAFKSRLAKLLRNEVTPRDISIRPEKRGRGRSACVTTGSCEVDVSFVVFGTGSGRSGSDESADEELGAEEEQIEYILRGLISKEWPADVDVTKIRVKVTRRGSIILVLELPQPLPVLLMQLAKQESATLLEAVPGRLLCCQLGDSKVRLEGCEDGSVEQLAAAMEHAKRLVVPSADATRSEPSGAASEACIICGRQRSTCSYGDKESFEPSIGAMIFAENHFDALGLSVDQAGSENFAFQVKLAVRRLSLMVHPDKQQVLLSDLEDGLVAEHTTGQQEPSSVHLTGNGGAGDSGAGDSDAGKTAAQSPCPTAAATTCSSIAATSEPLTANPLPPVWTRAGAEAAFRRLTAAKETLLDDAARDAHVDEVRSGSVRRGDWECDARESLCRQTEAMIAAEKAMKAMKAMEAADYIEVGLNIADGLLNFGEHAGIPLVGSVCTAARSVLVVLKAASTVVADAVEMGKRVVEVLELLQLMSENVSRMQAAGGIPSVEARMRELATLLGDVEKVVVTFGKKGWLRHALKKRSLSRLDADITKQLEMLMKFYQLANDADVQRRLAVREYPVEAEVERQVNQRRAWGGAIDPEALEADPEVVRGVAVASGLSAEEFSSELSALSSEVREGFGAHGLKLDEIKKLIEQMSQQQREPSSSSSASRSRLDQYTYEPTPGAPPGRTGKAAAKLGGGTFGVTYRMRKKDQSLDARRYAVKFIEDKGEQLSGETLQKEARLLSLLNHTHVVQQFDAFWHDAKVMEDDEVVMVKQFVIVMELLSGGSLKAKIAEPPPPAAETAEWMRQVASAIAYIHSLNIQHRDLKPANVMLDASGRAKIIDFGLACISDSSRSPSRDKVGSDAYSSPEKMRGERYGPADDVWAIGCMLAELLLGRPIGTVSISPDKRKRAITGSKEASQQLGSWVESCLQMEPRRRPTAQTIETSI